MLEVKVDTAKLEAYLKARPKVVQRVGRKLADDAAKQHTGKMISTRFRGYTGPRNTGSILQRRTGTLVNAMRFQKTAPTGEIVSASYVAGPIVYAKIQEFGGIVRPVRRRYLTIPTPAALTKAGIVRQSARPVKLGGRWMTNGQVPGLKGRQTFIARGTRGNPVIFGTGKDGKPVALWTLRKSVRVPARLGFFRTWEGLAPARDAALARAGKEIIDG